MNDDGRPEGSAGADAALRYAVAEAHRRGGRVLAVTACDSPELAAVDRGRPVTAAGAAPAHHRTTFRGGMTP